MRAKKNAPWGTQQTSQIPAALLSQSKIKQNPKPQVKSVVKCLALSPNRQSTRYISFPEHLNLSCWLWMPQGVDAPLVKLGIGSCTSAGAELHTCTAQKRTTIRSSPLTFTFDVWIAERIGPQNLFLIIQPQSCGFISAFERGMLLRLGEGTVWRSRDDRKIKLNCSASH